MASPQKENGYTQIANEILDAMAHTHLMPSEASVIWAIWRKTYGWHKKADSVGIEQIREITRLSRRAVIYAIQNLEAKKMLSVTRNREKSGLNNVNSVSFQKDYDKWVVQGMSPQYQKTLEQQRKVYKKGVVQGKRGSARNDIRVVQGNDKKVQILAPTKEKRNIQKKPLASKDAPLIVALIDSFEPINGAYKKWYARPPQRDACRRLIEQYGLEQVQRVVKVLPISNGTPYFPTITTPLQLEDNWARLESAWKKKKNEQLTSKNGIA